MKQKMIEEKERELVNLVQLLTVEGLLKKDIETLMEEGISNGEEELEEDDQP